MAPVEKKDISFTQTMLAIFGSILTIASSVTIYLITNLIADVAELKADKRATTTEIQHLKDNVLYLQGQITVNSNNCTDRHESTMQAQNDILTHLKISGQKKENY